ncbi:MAG TPA: CPBP family intramembrane glutamic endopeptidase [Intrasporangium sp.]|uniref:CPBP family intramembrane glutamic endopeptidase n=1 Tax=Intrasporangium sp. TaxID=1925024 RepID=UPI002B481EA0|nr:CPBP family intramembrane glutamic endopeptidase [Intrasporangium sp.]HKX66159.1 CPBP family intramembrane glutamic endopeptidase [Intrasporangium sp.]
MRGPVAELRAFVDAALVRPVSDSMADPPGTRTRRRVVVGVTLVVGALVLAWALRIHPGDPLFYAATLALAAVWAAGAVLSGPLRLGRGHTRKGSTPGRPVVQSLALGALLLAVFLAGALVVARLPGLREPVDDLLDHARFGSLPVVLLITVLNGVAEELYFRGALYAALPRHAVAVTTVLYALTTVGSGVPLLVLAATVVGLVTALQRRVTGGILGPVITHITWSIGMLLLLPPVLDLVR